MQAASVHPNLEALWQTVVERWDDPARHDALMGTVAQQNAFAWAAAKYKERAGDPVADKASGEARNIATKTAAAASGVGPARKQRHTIAAATSAAPSCPT